MTARELLTWATKHLAKANVVGPERDARKLLVWAADVAHLHTLDMAQALPTEQDRKFRRAIEQRSDRIPISHILGEREFFGRTFRVNSDVLDPRPDTETLIEVALSHPFEKVLDLGTGSGCILATLLAERPNATGVATDLSNSALDLARENFSKLGLLDRAISLQGSWFAPVVGQFDMIVSNPPYIAASEMSELQPEVRLYEPRMALTDEADGLECYREIVSGCVDYLTAGGRLVVEIGPTQAGAVSDLFSGAGLENVAVQQDLDGRDRVVSGTKSV